MKVKLQKREKPITGVFSIPSDKSLTHRSFMFAALSGKKCLVEKPLRSRDCMATKRCLELSGVKFEKRGDGYLIYGGLKEPEDVLNAGNSGTTARLITGMLSGFPFFFVVTGDASLRRRPMKRIVEPLSLMGAKIIGRNGGNLLPISVSGGSLKGIHYKMGVASAQVKSSIILAALNAEGETVIEEPGVSRDHTERMLKALGVDITVCGKKIAVRPSKPADFSFKVPGDPSSAAFLVALALLLPGSEIEIEEVLLNPTRIEYLKVLLEMGADVYWEIKEDRLNEPVGSIYARYSPYLKPFNLSGDRIPLVIDEIPILSLIATQAEGTSIVKDARELRVKESDRIKTTVSELRKLGADIEELENGMVIKGKSRLRGATVKSHKDHRIAMMLAVAACIAHGETKILQGEWVDVSFPRFYQYIT